ncbi:hypothetical protein BJY00DRAFT_7455 [Aspergillus carlsbadensis]|nr:hypothetical protein BJY00DRAFT_7455 [Aspergillus carlsbadensis]
MAAARRIIIGLDFGATGTAISVGMPNQDPRIYKAWPRGGNEVKVPSRIAYPDGTFTNCLWGFGVKTETDSCSWMKMLLDENTRQEDFNYEHLNRLSNMGSFHLPQGKQTEEVVADFLRKIYEQLPSILGLVAGANLPPLDIVLPIPAIWTAEAKASMEEVAKTAGFGDLNQHRLQVVTEPEAAAYNVLHQDPGYFVVGDGVLVCDCGGGTVDIATFLITEVRTTHRTHFDHILVDFSALTMAYFPQVAGALGRMFHIVRYKIVVTFAAEGDTLEFTELAPDIPEAAHPTMITLGSLKHRMKDLPDRRNNDFVRSQRRGP